MQKLKLSVLVTLLVITGILFIGVFMWAIPYGPIYTPQSFVALLVGLLPGYMTYQVILKYATKTHLF